MRPYAQVILFLISSLVFSPLHLKAADILTPCFLKVSLYTNITGTAVADLLGDAKYPGTPDQIRFIRSFNTRDALPSDALENFGGRIEGFLTPLEAGDYHFFLRSDDASELWFSTDDAEANAVLIAEETDSGDPFLEPDTGDAATSTPITLAAGKRYFIMVLYKSSALAGNSTDVAQVAWRKVGDATPAAALKTIPGAFLSTLANDAGSPKVTITQQPQDTTGAENSQVTFSIAAVPSPTNYFCIQWQRNGVSIPGATGTNYTRFLDKADNGATFRAIVAVPGASTNSADARVTVTDDQTSPVLLAAKGGPNRPEVTLSFSERLDPSSATTLANYQIRSAGAVALGVTEAVLSADQTQVTLKTDAQVPGTEYTVTVSNVRDLAAPTPRVIAANSEAKFFALGPWLQGIDGFVVWEAEDYDRNPDNLWVKDTERGVPSGGISMVNHNGAGGSEANTKLEYDIIFTKTGPNIIWWRSSGNDGNDDSAFLHLGVGGSPPDRPPNRTTGNLAALSATTSLPGNFAWNSAPFEGGGQMTFIIETAGLHTIAIARREDGTFVDKFVITTDRNFIPTTGFTVFGPPVTLRQGEPIPVGAEVVITRHPANTQGLENSSITLSAAATLPPGVLFTYQWQRKQGNDFVDIPGATLPAFTINPLTFGWNGAVVRMRVTAGGDLKYTDEATITVIPETTAPQLVKATGSALLQQVVVFFSEPVTPATAQTAANYKIQDAAGAVLAVNVATLLANSRTVILSTGPQTVGTKYTLTVNGVADTAAISNLVVNAQAKFYSLGALQDQGADGLLVFEAESFDRNLDDLWVEDNNRGNPSGGLSVVVPVGGTETATQLEYDRNFTKTGTNILWYRASGNDGAADSAWFWLDGARPTNRTTGNQASMTGFSGQQDFIWLSNPQDGGGQMTFVIQTTGLHTIGLGRRENGAFFDKFVITTDPAFNPLDYGPFGPPETRAGVPALPVIAITSPAPDAKFPDGASVEFNVGISATSRLVSKVEFFEGATKIGESTTSPFNFTWQQVTTGVHTITARFIDDVGDSVRSRPVRFLVGEPNEVLLLVGNPTLTAQPSDAAIRDRLAASGFSVVVLDDDLSLESSAFGRKLVINSSSVTSGTIGAKFRNVTVPVLSWEQANQDDFGMTADTAADHGTLTNQTQIAILATAHPLAAGFAPGPLTVGTGATEVSWGLPNANATSIATVVGNPGQVLIYGYESGAAMVNGFVAPARRVHFFLTDNSFVLLNPDGLKLFDAAVNWALGGSAPAQDIRLTASLTPGGLLLIWSGGSGPYTLQKKTTLSDPAWVDVRTGTETTATVPIEGQSGFFRVITP